MSLAVSHHCYTRLKWRYSQVGRVSSIRNLFLSNSIFEFTERNLGEQVTSPKPQSMVDINATFNHSTHLERKCGTALKPSPPSSARRFHSAFPFQQAGASHRRRRSAAPASPSSAQRSGQPGKRSFSLLGWISLSAADPRAACLLPYEASPFTHPRLGSLSSSARGIGRSLLCRTGWCLRN